MSHFDPNTESKRRARETERRSNQTLEDTSKSREGFPREDDTVICHNSCHTEMVQQFPVPHLLFLFGVCLQAKTCAAFLHEYVHKSGLMADVQK